MGAFIAGRRKEKNLTQKQLADQLGVTDKAVSKWERDMGYPDITLLVRLADCLGVTPGELLRGVREEPSDAEEPLSIMEYTYEYADRVSEDKASRRLRLAGLIFTAASFLAALTCAICDLSIHGRFTWLIFPLSSILFGWLVLAPLFFVRRQRLFLMLLSSSIFLLPFLLVLSQATGGGWFFPLGVPCALVSLGWLWTIYLTAAVSHSGWYTGGVSFLTAPIINLTVDLTVSFYTHTISLDGWDLVSAVLCVVSAAVLFAVGKLRRGR